MLGLVSPLPVCVLYQKKNIFFFIFLWTLIEGSQLKKNSKLYGKLFYFNVFLYPSRLKGKILVNIMQQFSH